MPSLLRFDVGESHVFLKTNKVHCIGAFYGGRNGGSGMTIIASMATAPFVLYHFNQVAKFGLLANMVAVPVTALLLGQMMHGEPTAMDTVPMSTGRFN